MISTRYLFIKLIETPNSVYEQYFVNKLLKLNYFVVDWRMLDLDKIKLNKILTITQSVFGNHCLQVIFLEASEPWNVGT